MIGKEILNYRIISFLGKGGMGSVYVAEHILIKQQKVAIKVINADMVNDFTKRKLQEEAELLASLNHPNIVDFKNYHIDEDGNVYLIMEYADGINLEKYIATVSGLIVEDRICDFFEPILDAFGYAHKHRILHRDIKPSNIIITKEGKPMILDFGIAKLLKAEGTSESEEYIMGTPSYMSPEQVRGEQLDARSDIYSLGVLLHQMLTGNAPYDTTTLSEVDINRKVVEEPLPRMKTYYKYISDKVQRVVDKAVAKRKEDRFQNCEEFKRALHQAIYPAKISSGVKIAAAILGLVLIGGALWLWDYNRVKVYYYKDYVEQWGVPQGIHELSAKEQSQCFKSYRLEYRQGRLKRLCYINSCGSIETHTSTDNINRPAEAHYFYSADGTLDYVKEYAQSGKVLLVKDYVNKDLNVVIFRYDDELGTEKNLSANTVTTFTSSAGDDDDKRSRISRYLLTYDENGYVKKLHYAGFQNARVCDAEGIFGIRYQVDEKGRVLEETFLDYNDNPKATKSGMAIRTREFNETDDAIRFCYLSPTREAAGENLLHVAVCRYNVDQWGNVTKEFYENLDGTPALRSDGGYYAADYEYVDGKNLTRRYYGSDGKPVNLLESGYSIIRYEYDSNGYISAIHYYDTDDQPTTSSEGEYGIRIERDERGNILFYSYLNKEGHPFMIKNGYASGVFRYDERGNEIFRCTLNAEGDTVYSSIGYAQSYTDYDKQNRPVRHRYFDATGNPISIEEGDGTPPVLRYYYSLQGNLERVEYRNATDDALLLNPGSGIAGWKSEYDEFGNETKQEFFDETGNVTNPSSRAFVGWKATYDQLGNQTSKTYYDASGQISQDDEGIATIQSEYDSHGNCTMYRVLDVNGKLVKGTVEERFVYDSLDNRIATCYFDAANNPVVGNDGYHMSVSAYDERRQETEIHYYDVNTNRCTDNNGVHIYQYKYDSRGHVTECATYNTKSQLCLRKGGEAYAIIRNEFDSMGRRIRQRFYGTDGELTPVRQYIPEGIIGYDEFGNINYLAAGDGNGNIVMNEQRGWAIKRMVKNRHGQELETRYYNAADKPIIPKDQTAHLTKRTYNEQGYQTSESYYDTQERPIRDEYGVYCYHYEYDEYGRLTLESHFGADNQPINANNGSHKWTYTYKGMSPSAQYVSSYDLNGKKLATYKKNGNQWERVQNDKSQSAEVKTEAKAESTHTTGTDNSEFAKLKKEIEDINQALPKKMETDLGSLTLKSASISRVSEENVLVFITEAPKEKSDISQQELFIFNCVALGYGRGIVHSAALKDYHYICNVIIKDSKGQELNKLVIRKGIYDLNIFELTDYPLGFTFFPKDAEGMLSLSGYEKAENLLQKNLNMKPKLIETSSSKTFNLYSSDGYKLTYLGLPIFNASMSFSEKNYLNKWRYTLRFSKKEYDESSITVEKVFFAQILTSAGYTIKEKKREDKVDYECRKGDKKVTITSNSTSDNGDYLYIWIDVHPNWPQR